MAETAPVPPVVDPAISAPARLHDGYLGGTSNYQADRDAAERLVSPCPATDPAGVHAGEWGADDSDLADSDGSRWSYAGVARRL